MLTLPWYCPTGRALVSTETARLAGVVLNSGVTANHCPPNDEPTAAKLIGAPVLVKVMFFCRTSVAFEVCTLNVSDGTEATSGPVATGPGGGPAGAPGGVKFNVTGIFKTAPEESVAAMFTVP